MTSPKPPTALFQSKLRQSKMPYFMHTASSLEVYFSVTGHISPHPHDKLPPLTPTSVTPPIFMIYSAVFPTLPRPQHVTHPPIHMIYSARFPTPVLPHPAHAPLNPAFCQRDVVFHMSNLICWVGNVFCPLITHHTRPTAALAGFIEIPSISAVSPGQSLLER